MSSFRRTIFAVAFALCSLPLLAQPADNGVAAAAAKSPVAMFRELLAMTPEQRKESIALRPPDIQKRILEKLNEYELLPAEVRELRLRETELRWYLRPLMDEPRTNRAPLLARIPEAERKEVETRLEQWDLLPPQLQDQFKSNDMIASYFSQIRTANPKERAAILGEIPPDQRAELEKGLDQWKQMSEDQRQTALAGFNHFFELTPEQKEKALDTLPDEERQAMQQTLTSYSKLTADQRAQCIRSFEKFASMSVVERQQFLKNAERWREMSPEERQKWRELVNVAPLIPPSVPSSPTAPNRSELQPPPALATN